MKFGLIAGFVLLIAAFIAAAAEMAALALSNSVTYVSAHTTLTALLPTYFGAVEAFVTQQIHPFLWEPVIRTILILPGWFLLGLPGVFLAWKCRPVTDQVDPDDDDQLPYTSYEDIVASAKEAEFYSAGDLGSKYVSLDEYDPLESVDSDVIEDYVREATYDVEIEAEDVTDEAGISPYLPPPSPPGSNRN